MSPGKDVEQAFARLDKETLLNLQGFADFGRRYVGNTSNVMSFLNVLRKEGESGFCDVVLEVDGQSFPAHRCVLAVNSQFFYTLFTSGMIESTEKHVNLSYLSSSAVSTILDFFYTRDIFVNKENAEELLEAASFLLLNHVKKACEEVISKKLSISNCFSTKRLAERYGLDELSKKADLMMKENFQAARQEKEFLELEPFELKELISSDSVRVEKEEEVFEAMMNWVKHNLTNRANELSTLLPCLRYGSLSPEFVEEQFRKDRIFDNFSFCENFLKLERQRQRQSVGSNNKCMLKERPSAAIHDVLIGIAQEGFTNKLFCYDLGSEQFFKLPDPRTGIIQLGSAVIGRKMYTVCRYKRNCNGHATFMMKHELGSDNNSLVDHFWDKINTSPLKPNTCYDKAIVLSLKDKLYIVGGCMHFEGRSVDIQCYDPAEGKWKAMANMNTSRCRIGAVATSNYIYAVGGAKSHAGPAEKVVERYDPDTNEWTTMADMCHSRDTPKVINTSNSIFAIGGSNYIENDVCFFSCEVYEKSCNKWSVIAAIRGESPTISFSLNDEVYAITQEHCWGYFTKTDLWRKSEKFKALKHGAFHSHGFNLVQLQLPKFCYDQCNEIALYDVVHFDEVLYILLYSDDCDDHEDEE